MNVPDMMTDRLRIVTREAPVSQAARPLPDTSMD
jgi:hypothetical protein